MERCLLWVYIIFFTKNFNQCSSHNTFFSCCAVPDSLVSTLVCCYTGGTQEILCLTRLKFGIFSSVNSVVDQVWAWAVTIAVTGGLSWGFSHWSSDNTFKRGLPVYLQTNLETKHAHLHISSSFTTSWSILATSSGSLR